MTTWQLSSHTMRAWSLILPTAFQSVCALQHCIRWKCVISDRKQLLLRRKSVLIKRLVAAGLLRFDFPVSCLCSFLLHFHLPLCLPFPVSHHHPLIPCAISGSKPTNSRPFFGDICRLSFCSQPPLPQFQSACRFEGAARCYWLNHMSCDTLSCGLEGWGGRWGAWVDIGREGEVKDEAIWSYL